MNLEQKKSLLKKIEEGNDRSYQELRQAVVDAGGDPRWGMDTDSARRELFIEHLVQWGVITEEQKIDFDIAFHKKVDESLNETWAKFRAARAQQQQAKLTVVKKGSKLLGADGKPLT